MSAPRRLLITGGTGGIGSALLRAAGMRWPDTELLATRRPEVAPPPALATSAQWLELDLESATSISACAERLKGQGHRLDAVVLASGWLHDAEYQPEKSVRNLKLAAFERAYRINAAGPLTLVAELMPLLRASDPDDRTRLLFLSAKVGSIRDNGLGGWHSYRLAKAALNMGVRNLGIEFERNVRSPVAVAVHPGTTQSPLSEPFSKRGLPVVSAAETAERLLDFLAAINDSQQGGFYHWDGSALPY